MNVQITVALIAGAVTACGWLVVHILQRQRDDRKRRLEARVAYVERQIEELYGPLFNLTMQIVVTNHVLHGLLQSARVGPAALERQKVEDIFYREYFQPLHDEIRTLLKSRLHLVERSHLPNSFYEYLRAAIQQRVQRTLWDDHHIETSAVEGRSYPNNFTSEVQQTLERLLEQHDVLLQGLHAGVKVLLALCAVQRRRTARRESDRTPLTGWPPERMLQANPVDYIKAQAAHHYVAERP